MIPNQFQTYEKGNTIAKSGKGNAIKNGLFIVKTKTIPIDDLVKI